MIAVMSYLNYGKLVNREGNGNPLQCSCLENSRDGGAWWAAVCGVAQSRPQLKQRSSSSRQLMEKFHNTKDNNFWKTEVFRVIKRLFAKKSKSD